MEPKISIVTICFNNLQDLLCTIARVDMQTQKPFEHIIIDGSTNSEINNWLITNQQPAYRKWICEPDKGISDAFNKGILRAEGNIVHLHNAGDYYFNEHVLKEVNQAFTLQPNAHWLHGKYIQFRGGIWVESGAPFNKNKLYRGMRTIGHPTMFLKKELYTKYGLFNIDKKIAMDYDLLIRIADEPFIYLDKPLVYFMPGGVSNQKVWPALNEIKESYYRYKGKDVRLPIWNLRIWFLHKLAGSAVGKMLFSIKNKKRKHNLKNDN